MSTDQPVTIEPAGLGTASAPAPAAVLGPGEAARSRRYAWVLRPVVIYLASRALTTATLAVMTAFTHHRMLGEIDSWDSKWLLRAAAFGWPAHLPHHAGHVGASTIAFFPLFPLSVRYLADVTGGSVLAAGIVVSSLTGLSAIVALWWLVHEFTDRARADRATVLVALFPGAFVLSLIYSEGMILTLVALGLLALLRRRWVLAGLCGMAATATAPIALAFEASCLWAAYRAIRPRDPAERREWRALVAPVLTPVGFCAYQVWLWRHTAHLDAWRMTERGGWKSYPSLHYPLHIVAKFVTNPIAPTKTGDLLFVGIVVALIGAVAALRTRLPAVVLAYGLTAGVLAAISAPVGLRPRFVFVAFPLVVAIALWCRGRAYTVVLASSTVLLVAMTAFTVGSYAIFP